MMNKNKGRRRGSNSNTSSQHIVGAYCVPGTLRSISHMLIHLLETESVVTGVIWNQVEDVSMFQSEDFVQHLDKIKNEKNIKEAISKTSQID